VEGIPYGRKKIDPNQPIQYIARDVAIFFKCNLYEYQYDEIDQSLLVIMTNGRRVRIHFSKSRALQLGQEQKHDEQETPQQEQERQPGGQPGGK
jgi:hypothetical protein